MVVHVPASSVEVGLLVGMGSRRVQWVVSNGILFVYPRGCLARSFPVASNPSFDWIVWFALDLGVEG